MSALADKLVQLSKQVDDMSTLEIIQAIQELLKQLQALQNSPPALGIHVSESVNADEQLS